jgi:hypothetical protein
MICRKALEGLGKWKYGTVGSHLKQYGLLRNLSWRGTDQRHRCYSWSFRP